MDTTKYVNMVYNNSEGKKWWRVLQRPDIWAKWDKKVQSHAHKTQLKDYAQRILIEALWHFGYAQDYTDVRAMARCARRLRQPPETGAGELKTGVYRCERDLAVRSIPWELQELDDFLEYYVRPLVP